MHAGTELVKKRAFDSCVSNVYGMVFAEVCTRSTSNNLRLFQGGAGI